MLSVLGFSEDISEKAHVYKDLITGSTGLAIHFIVLEVFC